ncbi:hypothetical protein D3C80_1307810 [compost metagenome]
MTIISGGIRAIMMEILYSKSPMVPIAQITVIITTNTLINVTRTDRKKKYMIPNETNNEMTTKMYISDITRFPIKTRM